jgi:hypothetical protein
VHPVVGWWARPHPVVVVDVAEVAAVARVPIAQLVDPQHGVTVRHPSGLGRPAFDVDAEPRPLLVWGFTAGLLDRLLALGGWERPWDSTRQRELDPDTVALARRGATFPVGLPTETA